MLNYYNYYNNYYYSCCFSSLGLLHGEEVVVGVQWFWWFQWITRQWWFNVFSRNCAAPYQSPFYFHASYPGRLSGQIFWLTPHPFWQDRAELPLTQQCSNRTLLVRKDALSLGWDQEWHLSTSTPRGKRTSYRKCNTEKGTVQLQTSHWRAEIQLYPRDMWYTGC